MSLLLLNSPAQASNLLVNPSFEANSGQNIPVGWTHFTPPDATTSTSYWIDSAGNHAHTGNLYWKQWGIYWDANRTNVAGIYQEFNSAPTSTYQANGWFYTPADDVMGPNNVCWVEVSFRDSGGNTLALYKSDEFSQFVGKDEWFQFFVTNACNLSAPISTGDPSFPTYAVTGAVNQLVAPAGTVAVRYRYVFIQGGGWPEGGGAGYFDDAVLDQLSGPLPPVLSNVSPPTPGIYINPNDGIAFTASSPSGTVINNAGIHVVVNGADVSSSLNISGSSSSKTVTYSGLASNTVYNVSIVVTDAYNFVVSQSLYFETTWVGVLPVSYFWEAEDFDFDSGKYINSPDLCSAAGNPNCYFGKAAVQGVDANNSVNDGDHLYRPEPGIATTGSGDLLRKPLVDAGRIDYKVGWFESGEWVNYTRDWPAGTWWIIARLANGGGSGTLTLSKVNGDGSTTDLGTFTVTGSGWTTYYNCYLMDTNGNIANIALDGKATLRATTGGNVDMGLFMLTPAKTDLPVLSNLYPNGTQPFQKTNALSFTATSKGGVIPASGIKVILDGIDISSGLAISGSDSAKNVLYTSLQPNAPHTATITVTNQSGTGMATTYKFDTFSQDNYIVDAEDYDFNRGQFHDNPVPNAYAGEAGAIADVDFHHTPESGETFAYRMEMPTQASSDFLRQAFADAGATDYNVGYFENGEWFNLTRTYPSGQFTVYGRFAGSGGYSMYLSQVVSGVGTTNQVLQRLGRWGAVGRDWQLYDWVPLTDEGLAAPVVLSMGGVATLRVSTTGGCNPNFIMFVPVSGISLSATKSGNNIALSFPTQAGVSYRVFYKTDITSGNWTLLTTVGGDGSVKTVTDPISPATRFYQVMAP